MIPDRLHEVLRANPDALGARDYDVTKLQGDASSRMYFRARAGERSVIAMVLPDNQPTSLAEEITKVSGEITELPFINVQKFFAPAIRVPKIHAYDAGRGVLLLEDFGDDLLLSVIERSDDPARERIYEKALDELAKISSLARPALPCLAFQRRYDRDLYNWEFLHFVEYAIDRPLAGRVSPTDRDGILSALYAVTDRYLDWECVVSHRDYHARNLLLLPNAQHDIGVIDFQDALLAPVFYDLASLLRDSYFAIEPNSQARLLETYRAKVASRGLKMTASKDEFRFAFDLMGLQRNMKAAGRFFYIDIVKKNPNYLKDVPRAVGYIRSTLENHGELRALRARLLPLLDDIVQKAG